MAGGRTATPVQTPVWPVLSDLAVHPPCVSASIAHGTRPHLPSARGVLPPRLDTPVRAHLHVHTCTYTHTRTHTYMHTCAHMQTHAHTHARPHVHTHARTPAHTHMWCLWGTAVSLKNRAVDETKVISCGVLGPCASGLSPGPDFPPCHLEPDAAACERALMWEAACSRASLCVRAFRPRPPPQTRHLRNISSLSMVLFSDGLCSQPPLILAVRGAGAPGEGRESRVGGTHRVTTA